MYNSIASIHTPHGITLVIFGLQLLTLGCPLPETPSETGNSSEAESETSDPASMLTETSGDPLGDTGDQDEH